MRPGRTRALMIGSIAAALLALGLLSARVLSQRGGTRPSTWSASPAGPSACAAGVAEHAACALPVRGPRTH